MGIGVVVGTSVGMIAVSVGGRGVGGRSVAVGDGSGADELQAAMIKDKRIARKIVRRIGIFYWLWGAS
jgi:hypothetical protein